ncbi:MAG: hypothetical protein K0R00_3911 [Herbinix sp.]|jgi:hypothetical protein|nr:hypothetical protein [Herbinix sp.]
MTDSDRRMYEHFFKTEYKHFIFKETQCIYCEKIIHNSNKPICINCDKPTADMNYFEPHQDDLLIAENAWLYKGL